MLVNGRVGTLPKRRFGFVFQDDLLLSQLTVRETVAFAAALKLPARVGPAARAARVAALLRELGLERCAGTALGAPGAPSARGVSGGERKRTAVAVELVTQPSVLLCDEPSTGLDAATALRLMQTLRALADGGLTVLCSIHQPRTSIYTLFDTLLLLQAGRVCYDGAAASGVAHLERALGAPLPLQTNAADWLLDQVAADEAAEGGARLPALFAAAAAAAEAAGDGDGGGARASTAMLPGFRSSSSGALQLLPAAEPKYARGFWAQFRVLLRRCGVQQRGTSLTRVAVAQSAVLCTLTALFWLRMPPSDAFIPERISLLFFLLIAVANVAVNSSLATFAAERPLLVRERAKGMYRIGPYFLAKTLNDMAHTVALPIANAAIVYWVARLRPEPGAFFTFLAGAQGTLSAARGRLLTRTRPPARPLSRRLCAEPAGGAVDGPRAVGAHPRHEPVPRTGTPADANVSHSGRLLYQPGATARLAALAALRVLRALCLRGAYSYRVCRARVPVRCAGRARSGLLGHVPRARRRGDRRHGHARRARVGQLLCVLQRRGWACLKQRTRR